MTSHSHLASYILSIGSETATQYCIVWCPCGQVARVENDYKQRLERLEHIPLLEPWRDPDNDEQKAIDLWESPVEL